MKTNAPRLFFVDKESGVSFDVFHVLSVSFPVTVVPHMTGECNIQNLTENVPFVGTGNQSCIQGCVTIPDKWNIHVDVKGRHCCCLSLLL
ncbi:hypothetical protein [Escherichia coli]|uniref:hypothetical protein n=1 Tax=Escherichia coli TaxID=562 RepID=UPI00201E0652|nr:hypothetical protein [Escherichia coli]